jgi:hypothetical protein
MVSSYVYTCSSVDVLSRKCHLRPLKGKTSAQVARAFENIVETSGDTPSYVVSDRLRGICRRSDGGYKGGGGV